MIEQLKTLPKPHYHWPHSSQYWPGDDRVRDLMRVCGACSVSPDRQSDAHVRRQIDLAAELSVPVGIVYSPWMSHFKNSDDPSDEGPKHTKALQKMFRDLSLVRDLAAERGLTVDVVAYDFELWNGATRKANAVYDLAKMLFQDAIVDWYGSGWKRSNDPSGWNISPLFDFTEKRDTLGCDLYAVGELDQTRETYRKTVQLADVHSQQIVTPWVALAAGYAPTFDGAQWSKSWDYDPMCSWQLGREINNRWFGDRPERFAPWNRARHVIFYPQPWANGDWEKHFVAYCLGAAQNKKLNLSDGE